MAKTREDKKMNRIVKKINKQLREDVFGDRFYIKQVAKQRGYDGLQYYLYEMVDNLEPYRNSYIKGGWVWGGSQFAAATFYENINDFIVRSDFWAKYRDDFSWYDPNLDTYAWRYNE